MSENQVILETTPVAATVVKKFEFSAAHAIFSHPGACHNIHGHNFEVEVHLMGEFNPSDNLPMAIEFKAIKKIVQPLVDALDHSLIVSRKYKEYFRKLQQSEEGVKFFNNVFFMESEPTAENIALMFKNLLLEHQIEHNYRVVAVVVRETPRSEVVIYG